MRGRWRTWAGSRLWSSGPGEGTRFVAQLVGTYACAIHAVERDRGQELLLDLNGAMAFLLPNAADPFLDVLWELEGQLIGADRVCR